MPHTHTRTFRIRHYECDAYGHLNAVNYVRYMQEAAFDASAAAGYGLPRYDAMGRMWLVKETEIDYLAPMRYGDSVTVTTWVADFRKVRSRRAYEMHDPATGRQVARASTDWVFLEKPSGRPAEIPREMMAAFFPEGIPEDMPAHKRFPPMPKPAPVVYRQNRRVEWRDLDPAQHVNNSNYLAYVEECGVQVGNAFGWPETRLQTEGLGIFTRRHQVEYKAQAVLDDEIEVATWFSNVRTTSCTRHYVISRVGDGAVLANVHSVYVWVDLSTGQAAAIPERLLADFADNRV